jgi:hypothetical protein
MAKKTNNTFSGAVAFNLDLIGINSTPETVQGPVKEKDKPVEPTPVEIQKSEPKQEKDIELSNPTKKRIAKIKGKDDQNDPFLTADSHKLLGFNTERSIIDKFVFFCPKIYMKLRLSKKQQSFSYVFHLILNAMKDHYIEVYENILPADDFMKEFFTNSKTKGSYNRDKDQIIDKTNLTIKATLPDIDLLFDLMNTRYHNFDDKPTRYSINFFFFEIVRFMEDNY